MRNLKKVLALVIAFSMMLSVVAFAGYNDVDADADYAGAVELLSALNIIKGDDQGNFNPDNTITRSEMAAIICRAKGLEDAANGAKGPTAFTDVAADHWASGYINLASQNGIIAGYGNGLFGPEDTLTYEAAVAMIVRALGFEPMAAQKGGWSAGYVVVANTYKITAGADSSATRANVAILMANAMNTPMMDQTTYGADAEYEVLDGKKDRDYRTLLTDMDIYVATGVVGEKEVDEIAFTVTEDSDCGTFVDGDGSGESASDAEETFIIGDSDIALYTHQQVDAYVKEDGRDYVVVAVVPSTMGETFTLLSDDIKKVITDSGKEVKVEYYVDPANSSKTKEIKIDLDGIEYNKAKYTGTLDSLVSYYTEGVRGAVEDIELVFVENGGDTTYDVVVATKYTSAIVKSVNADRDRLEVKVGVTSSTIEFDFDAVEEQEDTVIFVDDAGNELQLSDFAEDDVVAIVADKEKFKNYDKYIKIVKLSNAVVTGAVDEAYTSNGDSYVTVDGKEYQLAPNVTDVEVGSEGTFYVGMTGKVILFDGSAVGQNYAYVLEAAISDSAFTADRWQIKLLTKEDGIVTYDTTDDASDAFAKYLADNSVNTYDSKEAKQVAAATAGEWLWNDNTENKFVDYRLITFKTNAKGEIKSFEEAANVKTGAKTEIINEGNLAEYSINKQKIDSFVFEDDVIIFNVEATKSDDAYRTDINYLVDEAEYKGFVHTNKDGDSVVMVVTEGEAAFSEEAGFAVATKVSNSKDADGEDVTKISYVQDEVEGTITIAEDADVIGDITADKMSVGDVFMFNANAEGVVSKYAVIAQIVEDKAGRKEIKLVVGEDFLGGKTKLYGGYIVNDQEQGTSRGETITVAAMDGKGAYEAFITADTYKYSYVNIGRNVVIETEDIFAEDAFYKETVTDDDDVETTYFTPVVVRVVEKDVIDIYTSNDRIPEPVVEAE